MTTPWLLREPAPQAESLLLCLPVSGLGTSTFRNWPPAIGRTDICLVQLPGRENRIREKPCLSMTGFAQGAAAGLAAYLDRPYALFGHCLGGRLAYALAMALISQGASRPGRLIISSCLAPHEGGRFGPYLPEMTDEGYMAALRSGCDRRGEPVPPEELQRLAVRVLRADVELSCGYSPAGPPSHQLDITTIGWTRDADVHHDQMGGWAGYGQVRHFALDGDEFAFRSAPPRLRELIEAELAYEPKMEGVR